MRLLGRRLTAKSLVMGLTGMILLFLLTACGNGGGGGTGTGSIAFSLSIQDSSVGGSGQLATTCLPSNHMRGGAEKNSSTRVESISSAGQLSGLMRYASFLSPSDAYAHSAAKIANPHAVENSLLLAQLTSDGIDCSFHQIAEIVAYVYDATGFEIAKGGPWPCDQHSGTIESVPAGEFLTLKLYAIEICSGEKIFYGERGYPDHPISVLPGKTNDVGQIALEPISNPWQLTTIGNSIACINGYNYDSLATSIAISPKDNSVHIGYFDCGNNEIKYATNASGSWVIETVANTMDTYPIGFTSIAMDYDGLPHLSYIGDSCGDGCYALYYSTRNASGEWSLKEAYVGDYMTPVASRNTSIAVRSDATQKVADITCIIGDDYYGFSILYVNCGDADETCSSVVLEPGEYASLAHDSRKFAHIGYSERQGSDRYVKYTTNTPSGEWQQPDTLGTDNTEFGTVETSIALDSNDTAHISYCDINNSNLKYISGALKSWSESEIVESIINGCDHHSIGVDSLGNVHNSYNAGIYTDSAPENGLKYAIGVSGCWIYHMVDSKEISGSGDVGSYNSIAVDSSNNVHISYYDAYNGVLKYATRTIQR